jgi:hypothetical protein
MAHRRVLIKCSWRHEAAHRSANHRTTIHGARSRVHRSLIAPLFNAAPRHHHSNPPKNERGLSLLDPSEREPITLACALAVEQNTSLFKAGRAMRPP